MNKYPKYKPSGIDWIGEIPDGWDVKKIAHGFNRIGSGTTPTAGNNEYYLDGEYNWLQTGDLKDSEISSTSKKITKKALEDFSTLRFYPANSLVIAMYGATIGKTGILNIATTTNQACCVLSEPFSFDSKYAFYWFNAYKEIVVALSFGGGQPNISQEIIKTIRIPCPSLPEQTAIASFLDQKTAQIDTLISQKQKLIDVLKEERTAIIDQAVTKGIAPLSTGEGLGVRLKPSGIEWLGDIPEHWEVKKLSHGFSKIGSGTTPKSGKAEYYNDGKINWLQTGDLNDGLITQTSKKITEIALSDFSTLRKYPKGSLVIAMYGATIGKVGILGIETTTNQACCVISTPISFDTDFVYFWFVANKELVVSKAYGGGQSNISQDLIRSLRLPCPSIKEQKEIVKYLRKQMDKIDTTISNIESEIELMQEYRTALISEVVTGKVRAA